jgi:hypothetical protein
MENPPTHEDFSLLIGKHFSFAGHHVTLLLRSVDLHPQSAAPGTTRVPFTLVFEGPAGDILPADFHRATVQDGPAFELYISPIHTPAADHQDYQAVFN